jgi:hypothetical protein
MSLVGDALRKARQEAAERDAERRGMLFSARISDSPGRSHLGLGLVLGAVIALAATIVGGAAVWWVLGRGAPSSRADEAIVAEPTEPASESGSASDSASESVPDPVAGSLREPRPRTRQSPASADLASRSRLDSNGSRARVPNPDRSDGDQGQEQRKPAATDGGSGTSAGSAAGTASDHSTSDGRRPPRQPTGAEGFAGIVDGEEVYIMEADLGDVVLSLDFIVFRSEDSFAEINGIEVHLGGVVDGFRVKAIDKDRVHLSDGRRGVVLRAP